MNLLTRERGYYLMADVQDIGMFREQTACTDRSRRFRTVLADPRTRFSPGQRDVGVGVVMAGFLGKPPPSDRVRWLACTLPRLGGVE